MKSLLLQKLYHIHQGYFYAMAIGLLLFDAGMLILNRLSEAIQVDFWMTGIFLCIMILSMMNNMDNNWEKYRSVMPVTRKQIVAMEYLFLLGSGLVFSLIFSVCPIIHMLLTDSFDGKMLLLGWSSIFSLSIILFLFSTPVQVRFGEKGFRVFIIVIMAVLFMVAFLFSQKLEDAMMKIGEFIMTHDKLLTGLCLLGIIAVLTAVSWLLSAVLCTKRETA